mgnify:CR=1 FL=1
MNEKETRHTVEKKGQTYNSKHATCKKALRLVNCINKTKFNLLSGSKRSALNQTIQYKNIKTLI